MSDEITLFLIEDDDVDAEDLARALKKKRVGNPIVRARDGQEALDQLGTGAITEPFIILLDLKMPRMGGLEFLEALRSSEWHQSVVFVLTSSQNDQDICAAYDAYIAGYFVKNRIGEDFMGLIELIDGYWKIATLPKRAR